MKEVIRIDQQVKETEKPVEFTQHLTSDAGWQQSSVTPDGYEKIVYLGNCSIDGDMFACYSDLGTIIITKGHLNSGKY